MEKKKVEQNPEKSWGRQGAFCSWEDLDRRGSNFREEGGISKQKPSIKFMSSYENEKRKKKRKKKKAR